MYWLAVHEPFVCWLTADDHRGGREDRGEVQTGGQRQRVADRQRGGRWRHDFRKLLRHDNVMLQLRCPTGCGPVLRTVTCSEDCYVYAGWKEGNGNLLCCTDG